MDYPLPGYQQDGYQRSKTQRISLKYRTEKEIEFLWPLGIEKDKMAWANKLNSTLKSYGIYTIEDIAKTPIEHLEKDSWQWGEAYGIKPMAAAVEITTDWEKKSMSHENTFEIDYTDIHSGYKELVRPHGKTAYSLREDEPMAGCVDGKDPLLRFWNHLPSGNSWIIRRWMM